MIKAKRMGHASFTTTDLDLRIEVEPDQWQLGSVGLEVLEALENHTYDVVFLDVEMPEMDGLEAARRIVQAYGAKRPRLIALTAHAMREHRAACLDAGMDDFLTKPLRPAELQAALTRTEELARAA